MAEPLSITASIIAILGAAEKTGKGLERLRTLHDAPDDLEYVLNENETDRQYVNDMRVVLRSVQNAISDVTESEVNVIQQLIQRYRDEILKLDVLVNYHLQTGSGYGTDGRPKVNAVGWISKSGKLLKIRERLRDHRTHLVLALASSLFTIHRGIKLDIRDISVVSRGQPDQSLVRLDHPQAASMQHALEALLAAGSSQPAPITQLDHNNESREDEPTNVHDQPQNDDSYTQSLQGQHDLPIRSVRVTTALPGSSCGKFCQCQCHIHTRIQMPRWLTGALGTMFGSYQGTPTLQARPCNYIWCKKGGTTYSSFTYYFPSRFLNMALTMTNTWKDITGSGGSWHITMPQMIQDDHVVWGSHMWNDEAILDLFTTRRASPYMVRAGDGDSILFWAIHHWKLDICEYLLRQNAHRYETNKKGSSPHELAWTHILALPSPDRAQDVPRLRELFNDDDVFDNLGFTVLHMIVTGLKDATLETILNNDTRQLDKIDRQRKTALMWAAARGDHIKVATLLQYGASLKLRDKDGRTALSWAAWNGSSGCSKCVRLLLEHGADPNIKDSRNHDSPLSWALKGGNTADIVTLMLDHGASTVSPNKSGYQPLHRAAISGGLENATILLDRGANINADTAPNGQTPLLVAAEFNKPPLIRLFLEKGAKLASQRDKRNLLHLAAKHCDATVFNVIISYPLPGITAEDTDDGGNTAWDLFQQRRDDATGRQIPSGEYEWSGAALARLLELGNFC